MRGTSPNDDRVRAVIQWDVRNWSRALPFWQRWIDAAHPGRALAIGERGGGLSLWLASQGVEVVCSDLRTSFEAAQALHAQFGVSDRVSYEEQDATALTHGDETFDLVIFKSVLGALSTKERQLQAIREMHRVLRPGGVLLFAENLAGSRLHVALRQRFIPWDTYWRYLDLPQDRDLFAAFDEVQLRTWGVVGLFGRSERQRDLLARVDALVSPRVPARWRYIVFGAARKGRG